MLGSLSFIALIVLIRWANDARFVGWRLRRWHERSVPQANRMWLPWFAWRPVKTVTGEVVWLQYIDKLATTIVTKKIGLGTTMELYLKC
jgi:hypothetical protein